MLRVAMALLVVVFAVEGGVLRDRLADDLPSGDDVISALNMMADMKLNEVAKVLRKSDAVRFTLRRAAMDINQNEEAQSLVTRVAMDPKVNELFNNLMSQTSQLTVRDLTNLRQKGSPALKQSVRAALDSLMADESSRPLATHLKQAWDAESVDEQLSHLNMALDVFDSSSSSAADAASASEEEADGPEVEYEEAGASEEEDDAEDLDQDEDQE